MKVLHSITATGLILAMAACHSGGSGSDIKGSASVDNGGDYVLCAETDESNFEESFIGHFALDYLFTINYRTQNRDLIEEQPWGELVADMHGMLAAKDERIAASYKAFIDGVGGEDAALKRRWVGYEQPIVDLVDEVAHLRVPDQCYAWVEGRRKIHTIQGVRRKLDAEREGWVNFHYYQPLFERMQAERPLQNSFLLVHEWLWDFTSDPETNQYMNRLLHTKMLHASGPTDFNTLWDDLELGRP